MYILVHFSVSIMKYQRLDALSRIKVYLAYSFRDRKSKQHGASSGKAFPWLCQFLIDDIKVGYVGDKMT